MGKVVARDRGMVVVVDLKKKQMLAVAVGKVSVEEWRGHGLRKIKNDN